MLSKRFTAREARTIASSADKFLDAFDALIQKAVLEGKEDCRISLCEGSSKYNDLGNLWYSASEFIIAHYVNRGFAIVQDSQCLIIIRW